MPMIGLGLGLALHKGGGWRERILTFIDLDGSEYIWTFLDPDGTEYILTGVTQ